MIKESLFFDTDCLSAFLWVNEESLLPKLFPGKIIIPQKVYDELSNPKIPHLKARIDTLANNKQVLIKSFLINSEEFNLYKEFTQNPKKGFKHIGDGEAASLAMAKVNNGIIASNNLRDIMQYVNEFSLKYITTGDILEKALNTGLITMEEGENIWASMLAKRRKLGANSFEEYMKDK